MRAEFVVWPEESGALRAGKIVLRPETPEEQAALANFCAHVAYEESAGRKMEILWSWERVRGNRVRNTKRAEAAVRSQEAWRESMRKDREPQETRRR